MTNTKPAQCHCGARSWSRDIPAGRYVCVSCYRPLWQPIETAPMDGTNILVSDGGPAELGWHDEYDPPEDPWCGYLKRPKYWMPLPEPPKDD